MKKWIFILMASLPLSLSAQLIDPVVWDFELKKTGTEEYEVQLTASLEAGWYIYSANLPSDEGPVATSISFSAPEGLSILGKVEEAGKKVEGYDDLFGMNVIKYSSQVVFSQKIKVEDLDLLEGSVRFMTCDEHKCLPPKQIPFELQPE
jgi:thiol:disulfide interchange protein DsbD